MNNTRLSLPVAGDFAGLQKDHKLTAVSVAAMVAPAPAAAGQLTPKVLLVVAVPRTYDLKVHSGFDRTRHCWSFRAQRRRGTSAANTS